MNARERYVIKEEVSTHNATIYIVYDRLNSISIYATYNKKEANKFLLQLIDNEAL